MKPIYIEYDSKVFKYDDGFMLLWVAQDRAVKIRCTVTEFFSFVKEYIESEDTHQELVTDLVHKPYWPQSYRSKQWKS